MGDDWELSKYKSVTSLYMSIVYNYNETKLVKKGKDRWELTVPWEGETKKFWVNFPFNLLKIMK